MAVSLRLVCNAQLRDQYQPGLSPSTEEVPMELNNSKTSNRIGQWSVTNIMDVSMPELCGDYESALDVPE